MTHTVFLLVQIVILVVYVVQAWRLKSHVSRLAARLPVCPYGQTERDLCAARPAPDSPPRWGGGNVDL